LKNRLETGIGFMYNKQIFTYNDFANTFIGEREIGASQFMLPISYNFGFFKNQFEGGLFRLKLGFMFQYNLLDIEDHSNELPGYKINDFSNGLLLGFETIPFQLNNGNRLGLTLEMYRGSQVYDDYYNREDFEMPGSSFFKAGIIYQLNFK
jgi:hypothetical protein